MKRWIGLGLALLLIGTVAYGIGTRAGRVQVTARDSDTGLLWMTEYDVDTPTDITWITPAGEAAFIMDENGNRAGVAECGALQVVQCSGLPQTGIDAAANADDTYYDVLITSRRCHTVAVFFQTHPVQISLDGGVTNGPAVAITAAPGLGTASGHVIFAGLDIPAGSVISARNALAASDYTNLIVSVW
jgi:uncharacterized membrane protein